MNRCMHLRTLLLPVILLSLASSSFAGMAERWATLKEGMQAGEALAALGAPLISNGARGYQRWIYDSSGEVLLYAGQVIAWTQPVSNPESEARPIEKDLPMASSRHIGRRQAAKRPATSETSSQFLYWRP